MNVASIVALGFALASGVILIATGIWIERRRRDQTFPSPVIKPLKPPPPTHPVELSISLPAPSAALPAPPSVPLLPPAVGPSPGWIGRFRAVMARHPAPMLGWLETIFWLFVLATVIDHAVGLNDSISGQVVWFLTIGPHELGHLICMPFGWTLHYLGGSLWQVLWWLLLAVWVFLVHRQISVALLFLAVTGHSFINLAPYIDDARTRDLPLLFGLDKSHHDWWNLLRKYDLLTYDHTLARLAWGTGVVIGLCAVGLGILTTWTLPRVGLGPRERFGG